MKRLSVILEEQKNSKNNPGWKPGNSLGVTNRFTPIENIATNVRNYFGATYGIVVTVGPDLTSLVLSCSRWINVNEAYKDICNLNVGGKTLSSYICDQGLCEMKLIANLGKIIAVFYTPEVKNNTTKELDKLPDATEYTDANANEDCEILAEYSLIVKEGKDDDDEMEDETPKQIQDIIKSEKKVKAAEEFANLINSQMSLPPDYYWKAVKDKDGNESIALRYKKERRRPFGKKAESVVSIMNIYGTGDEAIWVDPYDDMDSVPEDMKNLIENILNFLKAEKTTDVCVYSIKDLEDKDDDDNENENNENPDEDDNQQ